jgi:hypothetical protein
MKRVIYILLSFLIILNSSGYVLIYVERLANNKRNIESIIASSKDFSVFEKFIFTKMDYENKLKWNDEKEFEMSGNMYDIAQVEIENNQVIVYCIQDEKEEELNSNFEKVNKANTTKDKIHFSQTLSNAFNLIAIENDIYRQEKISDITTISGSYFNKYGSVFLQSPTPPPKFS